MISEAMIVPRFKVGQRVSCNFDEEMLGEDGGLIQDITIKISFLGIEIEYTVVEVVGCEIVRKFVFLQSELSRFKGVRDA